MNRGTAPVSTGVQQLVCNDSDEGCAAFLMVAAEVDAIATAGAAQSDLHEIDARVASPHNTDGTPLPSGQNLCFRPAEDGLYAADQRRTPGRVAVDTICSSIRQAA